MACEKLADAGLLTVNLRDDRTLTHRGRAFVPWIKERGHLADYFDSAVGGRGDPPVDMQALHEDFKDAGPSPRPVRVDPNKTMLPADFGPPRAMAARIADPVASPANETKGPAAEPG